MLQTTFVGPWSPELCFTQIAGKECAFAYRDPAYHHLTTDTGALRESCHQEACGIAGIDQIVDFTVDKILTADAARLRCVGGGQAFRGDIVDSVLETPDAEGFWWYRNDDGRECWDCTGTENLIGNCAGSQCPFGGPGGPVGVCKNMGANLAGPDCHAFRCPDGATIDLGARDSVPRCVRPIAAPPPPPPGTVFSTASTVNQRPRVTWSGVTNATAYRIYRQYDLESGFQIAHTTANLTFTDLDARVSGPPTVSQPFANWVRYYVVGVNSAGNEGSFSNLHYWIYTQAPGPN